ncbi:amine oxidase [flavin-containing] B [Ixodes scapularis]
MAGYAAFAYTNPTQPSTSKRQHKQTSTVVTFTQRNLAVTQHEIEDTLIPHVFLEIHSHKKGRPSIYVLNAYSSPKDSSKQAAALIHKAAILAGAAPLLIAGDFNARHQAWGYPRSLPKGVAVWNTLQTDHLTLITDPDYPTREGNSVSPDTTPDLSITRNIPLATWSNTRNTLGSDHFILEITIPDNTHKRRETAEKRLVNWDHFRALREEEGEAVDLGSWTRALQDSVRQATDTVPAASPEGRADAKLLHMWQALERLRARWSKQKRNRSLRKRISRLERDIETYAIELDSQHWGQICDQINGKLGLRDTWGLLRHLMDPQGSKTVQRNTLTKVASTFPGDARALIEALKDKESLGRRRARDMTQFVTHIPVDISSSSRPYRHHHHHHHAEHSGHGHGAPHELHAHVHQPHQPQQHHHHAAKKPWISELKAGLQ